MNQNSSSPDTTNTLEQADGLPSSPTRPSPLIPHIPLQKPDQSISQKNGSLDSQKPVGPMFYDANIGPTGYIVRFQLRLRSFGFPVCFCFPLHRKWQALKSGSLSASDG